MKTYTYYIYHIDGVKIGCTTELEKRMREQGFTEWEILWQQDGDYEFGWIAGDKELELQKEYGLPVDTSHYMITRENRMLAVIAAHKPEAKAKRSNSMRGNNNGKGNQGIQKSEEHKANIKEYSQNRPKEHEDKITASKIGKPLSEERKSKISESIKANPKIQCPHCDKPPMDPRNYYKWHGDNCKHKKG